MNDLNPTKLAKVLYFVSGPVPSAEQYQEAQALKANVVFRNAQAVPAERHALETCDGVAGEVPEQYADAFDTAKVAISKKDRYFKELAAKVGDEAPPQELQETANGPTGEGGIEADKAVTPTGKGKAAKAWGT